ncbi:MAG TPA: segregation/condensation protein A [Bacillota bacterium]|nr:segregation/condensation protein A [Bacillota bacterium]HPL54292.1 segregation/condensation protein A [Bacillota bacterium]
MAINVKLEVFEGPLDLLLHLIEKNELDIYDIPIAMITDQYLNYINMMETLDLEISSEFLLMAATLLEIKSSMLLPNPKKEENCGDSIDPREELVQKLIEYKKFKEASLELKDKMCIYSKVFYKAPEPIEDYLNDVISISNVSLDMLYFSFRNILLKNDSKKRNTYREIYREVITIEDKIRLINKLLANKPSFYFDDLFVSCYNKYEVIVTFLAMLELIKRKNLLIEQERNYARILIKRRVKGA